MLIRIVYVILPATPFKTAKVITKNKLSIVKHIKCINLLIGHCLATPTTGSYLRYIGVAIQ